MHEGESEEPPRAQITGVVLAGGLARRMGGTDKGLVQVAGNPMVSYIVGALRPQVGTLLINANRSLEEYAQLGDCEVIPDMVGDFAGPLAGMASAMQATNTLYLVTVPCDSPIVAPDFVRRLYAALIEHDAEISVAMDGERMQPVFAMLYCDLLTDLLDYLEAGQRKIDRWYRERRLAHTDFSDRADMFLNINTPAEREQMERLMRERQGARE
ncbi:MAG: molybdenum cofactor guanylyltransferase [Gammaproteobacteria bacterium]|nr:molybdenum cofactor guanylyltransferase [Gammaproteobacteria bacterium]NIR85361.1 molybdenum cofactor guanylyltransferase [Gammaproteobacteria bacterium]NIR88879.1 molybdenum cofactor guanylyltransferase [Gammaproteobacteria bacterium]NIU06487.1 molybdenum cofactor guanylyltransferase [Gammaproteobacteria bacterium]NIV53380.1 molybdenum cofactor guanylyltransferase [Gammaproteobacteria bacterium]